MDTSIELNVNNNIVEFIKQYISLFESFDNVYLFGSVLDVNRMPNDIDLLLIYSEDLSKITYELDIIYSVLSKVSGLSIDLTILSAKEEKETEFIKKINSKCLKLK